MASEITIHQAQEKVDQWIKTVGVKYFSELTNLGILMEEVGELSRIMVRKFGDQSFKNKEEEVLLADEMADVLFVLICLAYQTGIDLAAALEKNIQKELNGLMHKHDFVNRVEVLIEGDLIDIDLFDAQNQIINKGYKNII